MMENKTNKRLIHWNVVPLRGRQGVGELFLVGPSSIRDWRRFSHVPVSEYLREVPSRPRVYLKSLMDLPGLRASEAGVAK